MTHKIAIRSKSNSENSYRIEFTGGVEPESGIGGRDTITDDGRTCKGRVVSGVDVYRYWGRQGDMQVTDPDDVQFSINGKSWTAASKYGATRMGGGGGGGGGGGTNEDAGGSFDGSTGGGGGGDFDGDPKHGRVLRARQSRRDNPQTVGGGGDVGTVQGGVNTWPWHIGHDCELHLKKGVHNDEPGDSVNIPPIDVASAHGSAKIVGDRDNPEDYVLEARQINFQLNGGSAQNVGLEGVTVKGTVQARRGSLEIDSCRLIAGQRWGKGDNVPLDTYGPTVQVLDSVLKSNDAAINFVEFANVSLGSNTRIDVDGPVATSGQGGGVLAVSGNVDMSAPRLTSQNWDQSQVTFKDPHGATDGIDKGARADVRR